MTTPSWQLSGYYFLAAIHWQSEEMDSGVLCKSNLTIYVSYGGTLSRHGRHACRDMCSYNQHNRFISIESAGRKNNVANTLHHNTSHKNKCSENELNSWSINIYLKYTLKKRLNKLGDAENVKWFGFFFLKIREIQNGPLRINQDRVVIFDSHN